MTSEKLAILKEFGLSDQEIKLYTSLLSLGNASATLLAEETGLKRTTVYPILEKLKKEGLVTALDQGTKQIFSPVEPQKIGRLWERKLQSFEKILPYLESLRGSKKETFGVQFIRSMPELKSFYEHILDEYKGREYYIIGSAHNWIKNDPEYFLEYRRRRAAAGIQTKLLLSSDSKTEEGQNDSTLLRQFKYMPEKYGFKSTIDIYDDKIIIVATEIKALAVVIAIPPMVDVFRSVFEILWETLE